MRGNYKVSEQNHNDAFDEVLGCLLRLSVECEGHLILGADENDAGQKSRCGHEDVVR